MVFQKQTSYWRSHSGRRPKWWWWWNLRALSVHAILVSALLLPYAQPVDLDSEECQNGMDALFETINAVSDSGTHTGTCDRLQSSNQDEQNQISHFVLKLVKRDDELARKIAEEHGMEIKVGVCNCE